MQHSPISAEAYLLLVQQVASLADKEFTRLESLKNIGRTETIASRLPALISLANTLGYFRGQDGMFLAFRPKLSSEHQNELYRIERQFEDRLEHLTDHILDSPYAERYHTLLQNYYLARWLRTPSIMPPPPDNPK